MTARGSDRRRTSRRGAVAAVGMTALLALYLVVATGRAVAFLGAGSAIGVVFGIALLVLPLLAGFLAVRELRFGFGADRLLRRFVDEGGVPPGAGIAARPSGRLPRAAGEAVFRDAADEVEARPTDWRAWFTAGLAYDLCGDRRRGRQALRRAIALERDAPVSRA